MYSGRIQFSACHKWQKSLGWKESAAAAAAQGRAALSCCTTHLIYHSSDLLTDHYLKVQIYKQHLPGMQICSKMESGMK